MSANGLLTAKELVTIELAPGLGKWRFAKDAAHWLIQLDNAFHLRFGKHLTIACAYRPLGKPSDPANTSAATQWTAWNWYEKHGTPLAAHPGTSNHGLGIAADIHGGVDEFGTPEHNWIVKYGPLFGWHWGEVESEPWHITYRANPQPEHAETLIKQMTARQKARETKAKKAAAAKKATKKAPAKKTAPKKATTPAKTAPAKKAAPAKPKAAAVAKSAPKPLVAVKPTVISEDTAEQIGDVVADVVDEMPKATRKRLYRWAKRLLPFVAVAGTVSADVADVLPPKLGVAIASAFLVGSAAVHAVADKHTDAS